MSIVQQVREQFHRAYPYLSEDQVEALMIHVLYGHMKPGQA